MTEISSSQELPLSQETFLALYNLVPEDIRQSFLGNNEQIGESIVNIPKFATSSSLPVIDDFPGFYDFNVQSPQQTDNLSKSSPYVFSNSLKRLYIKKDEVCPFYFSTSEALEGFYVRAVVYFIAPENIKDTVIRCFNHEHADQQKGDVLSEHLVRCESQHTVYFKDSITKRLSVCVPYENPASGQQFVTHLFKFMCFTSCSGGPNRRPFSIVFSLEKDENIFGRCKIDLKVCCCPFRDKNIDENKLKQKLCDPSLSKTQTLAGNDSNNIPAVSKMPSKRKREEKFDGEKTYTIKVQHKECYDLLRAVKKYFYLNKVIRQKHNWSPTSNDVANLIQNLTSSTSEEEIES